VLKRSLQVIWPAFLMAGVTEMLVFAVVDPHELRWFGGVAIDWPLSAIYTVSFLIFWLLIATASAISSPTLDDSPATRAGEGSSAPDPRAPESSAPMPMRQEESAAPAAA
jgi:hypothetical protein